jgi:predicted nucleotidyltransferase component of viral defense system
MKSSDQLKIYIRKKTNELGIGSNLILRHAIFDFFLEKLSLSKYNHNFIIKGGFLVSHFTGIDIRTTMDLDVTLKNLKINENFLHQVINDIIMIKTDAQLQMSLIKIEKIHDEFNYPGFRATIGVVYDKIHETIKIDMTTGDIITPCEVTTRYETLIENKTLLIRTYNIETIIAEKLETILSRLESNTRMRDFYDIYILLSFHKSSISWITLKDALNNTMRFRGTYDQIVQNAEKLIGLLIQSQILDNLWLRYQSNYIYAKEIEWNDIIHSINFILSKIK